MIRTLIALLIHLFLVKGLNGQNQQNEYRIAYEMILADTIIAKTYCNGNAEKLMVHPNLNYFSIRRFKSVLLSTGEENIKKLERIDKQQGKLSDKYNYGKIPDKSLILTNSQDSPCAIICFDHMRESYLLAEISFYSPDDEWKEIVSNNRSHFILFDFRTSPAKYYLLPVVR